MIESLITWKQENALNICCSDGSVSKEQREKNGKKVKASSSLSCGRLGPVVRKPVSATLG